MASLTEPGTGILVVKDWLLANGGILTSAIAGIFGVFADHKSSRRWTFVAIAGVCGGMIWALLSAHYADSQENAKMQAAIFKMDTFIDSNGEKIINRVSENEQALLERMLGVRPEVARTLTPDEALKLDDSGLLAQNLSSGISPDRRQALTVWVFPHAENQVDFDVVRMRLQRIAGNVQAHPAKEGTAPANSVWYGGGATLEEAKAAALIVMSAGLQIRQICPGDLKVPNLLQIGGSVQAGNLPVLSAQSIPGLGSPVCAEGPPEQKR